MIVSIIIPAYNAQSFIAECLQAVLAQTFTDFEAVVVNDGSDDETANIIQDYARRDPRLKFFSQSHQGVSSARNLALTHASGKYFAFVDSDDLPAPTMIARLIELIEKDNADIAVGGFSTRKNARQPKKIMTTTLANDDAMKKLWQDKNGGAWVWNKLFKHKIFSSAGKFPDGMIYEDVSLIYHACSFAATIAFTNEPLYYYRQPPNSIRRQEFTARKLEIFRAYQHCATQILPLYPRLAPLINQQIASAGLAVFAELMRARNISAREFITYKMVILNEIKKYLSAINFKQSENKLSLCGLKLAAYFPGVYRLIKKWLW